MSFTADYRPVEINSVEDRERYCSAPGMPQIDTRLLKIQDPQAMGLMFDKDEAIVARSSLWWRETPSHAGQCLGLIGHYAARSASCGRAMLDWACARLAARGCSLAVGPIDGSTWQNYRLITERGSEPVFLFEPDNPVDWPDHFLASGFSVLAHYYSALNVDLGQQDALLSDAMSQLDRRGIRIRPLSLDNLPGELRQIHALSNECFRESILFAPMRWENFLAQYQALNGFVRPELILIAEQDGQMVGFNFAVPDMLQQQRGQPIDTIIIKTLAVSPRLHGVGLGTALAMLCHHAARGLGYQRAIHALMRDSGPARKLSDPIAKPMRRYALFARQLGTPR